MLPHYSSTCFNGYEHLRGTIKAFRLAGKSAVVGSLPITSVCSRTHFGRLNRSFVKTKYIVFVE